MIEQTLEVLKLEMETQFKMLSLAQKENNKILLRNSRLEIEGHI